MKSDDRPDATKDVEQAEYVMKSERRFDDLRAQILRAEYVLCGTHTCVHNITSLIVRWGSADRSFVARVEAGRWDREFSVYLWDLGWQRYLTNLPLDGESVTDALRTLAASRVTAPPVERGSL